ncbi:MAG: substrate-binding domain-containing protein [Lentisphaeria bacterium]|nr:substrate-binding domain-containing protein [Lentisphaeria bacterium]
MTPPDPATRRYPRAPVILIQIRRRDLLYELQNTEILDGILDQAHAFGWEVVNAEISHDRCPSGLLPAGGVVCGLPDDPLTVQLRGMGCPVVRIGRFPHPLDHLAPPVLYDFAAAARLAAGHFHERGFRDVAFIGRDPWGDMKFLYDAFSAHSTELGMTCHMIRIPQDTKPDAEADTTFVMDRDDRRARRVGEELKALPKPVGVLASSDKMGATICFWARQAGLAVPEDVAILGLGDDRFHCEGSLVSLSSVDMNDREYGCQAVCRLRRLINGEPAPPGPLMIPPTGVHIRRSTDVLAVDDPIVARALRFMWDHVKQPVTVDDVADHMAVSRRKLERAFRNTLGRGVNVELRRKRLEIARELLRATELTVADIADTTGIGSASYLHRTFQRQYGMTPAQFRQKKMTSR